MFQKRKPIRSPKYIAYIRRQCCCECMKPGPSDPHHAISIGLGGAMGETADDWTAVPLCRTCHTLLHDDKIPKFSQLQFIIRTLYHAFSDGMIKLEGQQ